MPYILKPRKFTLVLGIRSSLLAASVVDYLREVPKKCIVIIIQTLIPRNETSNYLKLHIKL